MKNMKIDGVATFDGGEYENIQVEGVATCKGDITAKSVRIDGTFKSEGGVNTGELFCEGTAEFDGTICSGKTEIEGTFKSKGDMSGERLSCDGMADISGNIFVRQIEVDGFLHARDGDKIEAERIECDGAIHTEGQISADVVIANGIIKAKEIVGDNITLLSKMNAFVKLFIKKLSVVELIEATNITLDGINAKMVNGENIVIGPKCRIDAIDCTGTLQLDPSARIGKITGDYTRL